MRKKSNFLGGFLLFITLFLIVWAMDLLLTLIDYILC